MTDIAHAAIDAGADVVMGHGPHYALPVEVYNGRPIFYGLSNLTFSTGHLGRKHAGWIGMLVELTFEHGTVAGCHFRFVRSNDNDEIVPVPPFRRGRDTRRSRGAKQQARC